VLQLIFISRGSDIQIWDKRQVGEVKCSLVRFAIVPDDTTAVYRENDGQFLKANIMYYLVKGALQESGVNSNNRNKALSGQSGGKGNRVLLADADIIDTLRKFGRDNAQAVTFRHGWCYGHYSGVIAGQSKYRLRKYLAVRGYILITDALGRHTMKVNCVIFGGTVALTLGG
jgi:hypothetical protein